MHPAPTHALRVPPVADAADDTLVLAKAGVRITLLREHGIWALTRVLITKLEAGTCVLFNGDPVEAPLNIVFESDGRKSWGLQGLGFELSEAGLYFWRVLMPLAE